MEVSIRRITFAPAFERCGRLILALLAQRHDDQNDQRDDVGEHLVELLDGKIGTGGDEDVEDVESAEENGRQHADIRTPDRENDQRNGEPAAVAEGVVRPHAAGVVHDVVQTAETRDHAADAGGKVLVLCHVDTGGVCRCSALTHGAQVEACARVLEKIGRKQRDDDGKVSEEAVGQEDLTEPTADAQRLAEVGARRAQRDRGNLAVGQLDERAAEEVADADAERCERKTGDVLVGAQRDGQQAVEKPHQKRAEQRAEHRDPDGKKSVHVCRGRRLLVEERADDAADTADVHHARDTEVQVAGLFR